MSWITIIDSLTPRPGGVTEIVATFVDEGAGKKQRITTQVVNPTPERIRQQLRLERARLDAVETAKTAIAVGQPFDIDVPDKAIEPEPGVAERNTYLAAYNHFRAVRLQFQDGLVDQKAVDDAFAALRALYTPNYIGVV